MLNPSTQTISKKEIKKWINAAIAGDLQLMQSIYNSTPHIINETSSRGKNTALIKAAKAGHTHVVQFLLNNGAVTRIFNKNGYTALDQAKRYHRETVVDLLFNHLTSANNTPSSRSRRITITPPESPENTSPQVTRFRLEQTPIANRHAETPELRQRYVRSSYAYNWDAAENNNNNNRANVNNNHTHEGISTPTTSKNAERSFQTRLAEIGYKGEIPEKLACPVTKDIMNCPITVSSGFTFDKETLEKTLKAQGNGFTFPCPMTRKSIAYSELNNMPNNTIKDMIEEFVHAKEEEFKSLNVQHNQVSENKIKLGEPVEENRDEPVFVSNPSYTPRLFRNNNNGGTAPQARHETSHTVGSGKRI